MQNDIKLKFYAWSGDSLRLVCSADSALDAARRLVRWSFEHDRGDQLDEQIEVSTCGFKASVWRFNTGSVLAMGGWVF